MTTRSFTRSGWAWVFVWSKTLESQRGDGLQGAVAGGQRSSTGVAGGTEEADETEETEGVARLMFEISCGGGRTGQAHLTWLVAVFQ